LTERRREKEEHMESSKRGKIRKTDREDWAKEDKRAHVSYVDLMIGRHVNAFYKGERLIGEHWISPCHESHWINSALASLLKQEVLVLLSKQRS
jgi:hypothetical protein